MVCLSYTPRVYTVVRFLASEEFSGLFFANWRLFALCPVVRLFRNVLFHLTRFIILGLSQWCQDELWKVVRNPSFTHHLWCFQSYWAAYRFWSDGVFEQAVKNTTPLVEVKARRVGGATYQVPIEVRSDRGTALALRWLIQFARQRAGKTMASKLANELMDAANQTGSAIRKREETHRMAEANKAFAHYRY